jgi:hypothetical protein
LLFAGEGDDAFNNILAALEFPRSAVKMFSARTAAIEHLGRRDVVNRSVDGAIGVKVHVGKGRVFLAGLVIRQRIIHDGVPGDLRDGDVLGHVVQVGAVVLAHQEELAAVAENGGANPALFEPGILLHDGDVPAIELAKLGVTFLDDFLPARNVEETGHFLIDIPFPQGSRQCDDVFAGVVGDEEASGRFQLLGRIGNVPEFKMGDFAGQRKIVTPSNRQP